MSVDSITTGCVKAKSLETDRSNDGLFRRTSESSEGSVLSMKLFLCLCQVQEGDSWDLDD